MWRTRTRARVLRSGSEGSSGPRQDFTCVPLLRKTAASLLVDAGEPRALVACDHPCRSRTAMPSSAQGPDAVEPAPADVEMRELRDPRDGSARLRVQAEVSHALAGVVTDYRRLIATIVRAAAHLLGD